MKSLATLIKLQKSLVDEQRRMLADLQNIFDRIEAEIAALQAAQRAEEEQARHAPSEMNVTLPHFIAKTKARLAQLTQAREDALVAIEQARDRLGELFETQKRYEIIRDHREAEAEAERARQERLELDEIAETTHQRRAKAIEE